MVEQNKENMLELIYELDRKRKSKADIPSQIYDEVESFVAAKTRYSTKQSFMENEYWQELPAQLRSELFDACLGKQKDQFTYFFNDRILKN